MKAQCGIALRRGQGFRLRPRTRRHGHPEVRQQETGPRRVDARSGLMSVNVAILKETRSREQRGANSAHTADCADKAVAEGYVGDGSQRGPATHVADVARLYVFPLERGRRGARNHAVTEEGIPAKDIAETIGRTLNLPVNSTSVEAARSFRTTVHICRPQYAGLEYSHATMVRLGVHRSWTDPRP